MSFDFEGHETMRPNFNLMKATLTGALGGLLFGFDTVVISGAIDALVKLYGLSDYGKGWTVAIALIGTVVGALGAGVIGRSWAGARRCG
jgi:SP family arabinose:H+ symporter-like MFS transporter